MCKSWCEENNAASRVNELQIPSIKQKAEYRCFFLVYFSLEILFLYPSFSRLIILSNLNSKQKTEVFYFPTNEKILQWNGIHIYMKKEEIVWMNFHNRVMQFSEQASGKAFSEKSYDRFCWFLCRFKVIMCWCFIVWCDFKGSQRFLYILI